MKRVSVIVYLAVALVSFTLGTLSSLNADESVAAKKEGVEINKKLDQILINQEEIKKSLKFIQNKV